MTDGEGDLPNEDRDINPCETVPKSRSCSPQYYTWSRTGTETADDDDDWTKGESSMDEEAYSTEEDGDNEGDHNHDIK